MHRQADDVARQAFAGRQAAVGDREIAIGGLLMHRFHIVDRGRNALRLQRRRKTVAVASLWQPDSVLRPYRGAAAGQARNAYDIAEALRVAVGDLVARGDLVLEDLQL